MDFVVWYGYNLARLMVEKKRMELDVEGLDFDGLVTELASVFGMSEQTVRERLQACIFAPAKFKTTKFDVGSWGIQHGDGIVDVWLVKRKSPGGNTLNPLGYRFRLDPCRVYDSGIQDLVDSNTLVLVEHLHSGASQEATSTSRQVGVGRQGRKAPKSSSYSN